MSHPLIELSVKGELSTEISALNIDLHMLTAYLVIPKAIRELSLEFVDRYFMAILSEAMQDGLVKGYLDGDGKTGPIGIFRQIGTSNSDGTNKAKTVVTNITKFSPKGLSDVRKTLTNNGKRVVDKLYLICNPSDEAEYVDPCMYGEALTGGYVNKSFIDIEKIVDANCPKGKAAFTIAGYYTMGTTGVTDGTVIEAKMNFGTIYYLDQIGGSKLGRRIDKLEKIGKATDSDKMNFAAKLIYAMVRSNGRKVTFDEALQLVPPDPTELLEVVEAYQKEVDKIKKKEESKAQMKAFSSR